MKKRLLVVIFIMVSVMPALLLQESVEAASLNISIDNGTITDADNDNPDVLELNDDNSTATIVLRRIWEETNSVDSLTDDLSNDVLNVTEAAEEEPDQFKELVDFRMEDTSDDMVIEADVKLSGTGTGYHAKIVMGTSQSAVSFGIQYDAGASGKYAGKTMALLENIQSNYNGEQVYPRFAELKRNRTYRLMLTLNKDGHGKAYVNGQTVGEYYNPYVVNSGDIEMWIEGAARLSGDSVTATFMNVRARKDGVEAEGAEGSIVDNATRSNGIACSKDFGENDLTNKYQSLYKISGTVHGIGDWDSSFATASSLMHIQF